MEDVDVIYVHFGIFYCHLVYFKARWYIFRLFGIFSGCLVYFSPFWYVVARIIWQVLSELHPSPFSIFHVGATFFVGLKAGLPDFFGSAFRKGQNIPNNHKIYQNMPN
jgi:hypothetical protein